MIIMYRHIYQQFNTKKLLTKATICKNTHVTLARRDSHSVTWWHTLAERALYTLFYSFISYRDVLICLPNKSGTFPLNIFRHGEDLVFPINSPLFFWLFNSPYLLSASLNVCCLQRTSHALFVIRDEWLAAFERDISCQLDLQFKRWASQMPPINYKDICEVQCVLIWLLAPGKRHTVIAKCLTHSW